MGRPIGTVRGKAPADRAHDRSQPVAMRGEPLGILLAHGLDPADQDFIALLDPLEAHAAVERQGFLRRIENLQEMAVQTGGGEAGDGLMDRLEGREQIAYQHDLRMARQRLEGGQARGGALVGRSIDEGRSLAELLIEADVLPAAEVSALLDPLRYIGVSALLVDRALEFYRGR